MEPLYRARWTRLRHHAVPTPLISEAPVISDLLYLQSLSQTLEADGRSGLDRNWTILPVGGLDKMPTFLALLTPQVYVVALHDVPRTSPQKLTDLVDKQVIKADQLLPMSDFVDGNEADIEDLFSEESYLALLNRSGVASTTSSDLRGGKRIVPRVERAHGEFSHYAPARYLANHLDDLRDILDEETLSRFEKLFAALNKKLT